MFDSICEKLFGTGKENQEKLLVKLILVSIAAVVIAVVAHFPEAYAAMFIIWGWRALCASSGIMQISKYFEYNIVIGIIAFLIWLTIGVFSGAGICVIGAIRFIQLIVEHYVKR